VERQHNDRIVIIVETDWIYVKGTMLSNDSDGSFLSIGFSVREFVIRSYGSVFVFAFFRRQGVA
jgi:hypothetical protein